MARYIACYANSAIEKHCGRAIPSVENSAWGKHGAIVKQRVPAKHFDSLRVLSVRRTHQGETDENEKHQLAPRVASHFGRTPSSYDPSYP